eukprot:c10664_g1_i1.p1 GENE.c10664_g1_i1~~c10664_g1_i1.p1  ORF type:complete len:515 (-),score=138.53 c10664_g1_i1:907-2397(-)
MKIFVHLEGAVDLTWATHVENPQEKQVQVLAKGFCKAFEEAHPHYVGLPILHDTIILSKSVTSANRKLEPESTISANNLADGADIFVHIDVEKATEAKKRMAVKKVEMVKPQEKAAEKKDKKKPKNDPDMKVVQKHLEAREIRVLRDKSKQMLEQDSHSVAGHYGLAHAFKVRKDWETVVLHLEECVKFAPDNLDFIIELGDSQLEAGDLEDALKTYQRGLTNTPEDKQELLMNFQIGIANTMMKAGRLDTAREVIVGVLKKDENHKRGLLAYARFLASQDKEEEEQLKVMLRLIVNDTENREYREAIAKLLAKESGVNIIRNLLPPNASSASAYALLGTIARDYSQITSAEVLHSVALDSRGYTNAAYALSLVHILELRCCASLPVIFLSGFFRRNFHSLVGEVFVKDVLKCFENLLTVEEMKRLDDEHRPRFLSIEYNAPPDIDTIDDPNQPATQEYSDQDRDMIALFFTLAKVLFWTGLFDEAARFFFWLVLC